VKTALVSGASGFIGGVLCRRLRARGVRVRALARGAVEPALADEAVAADLTAGPLPAGALEGVDTVFHLAGKAHALSERAEDDTKHRLLTVEGTRLLLEAAERAGVARFVFFSSVKAMGEEAGGCVGESVEPRPTTAYGRSKLAAEELVRAFGRRPGVGNKGNLARMLSAIDRGLFPPLPEVGNRRSMVHVDNVVDAALFAASRPEANGQSYIVADDRAYSTRELYEEICRGLGRSVPRWSVPVWALKGLARGGDAIGGITGRRFFFDSDALEKLLGSAWYSTEKIARELGYRPSATFHDALPAIVAWYRRGEDHERQ
jgi:UDP-glucose 4-epimerase